MTSCKLVCDTRERIVLRHAQELSGITYETQQITTGDYALIGPDGALIAIIERKSLDDYGASLKDSRHSNKEKLVAMREQTGCRIIYLIEGKLHPGQNECFAGIPYKYIESSIFHLILRESICVIYTRDTLDTAQTLARFVKSSDSLLAQRTRADRAKKTHPSIPLVDVTDGAHALPVDNLTDDVDINIAPIDATIDAPINAPTDAPINTYAIMTELKRKHVKSDPDIMRCIWAKFRGISVVSADEYISRVTIADLVQQRIRPEQLHLSNGKPPTKRALGSLQNISADTETALLTAIPGISKATASALIAKYRLGVLLSFDIGAVSIISVPGKAGPRKLGMAKAAIIFKYMLYTTAAGGPGTL